VRRGIRLLHLFAVPITAFGQGANVSGQKATERRGKPEWYVTNTFPRISIQQSPTANLEHRFAFRTSIDSDKPLIVMLQKDVQIGSRRLLNAPAFMN
jgi:hypothetical protein